MQAAAAFYGAARGRRVPADAAGGGQPLLHRAERHLQAALCEEKHRARCTHRSLLRTAGHGPTEKNTG